jgi:hypothetical protein
VLIHIPDPHRHLIRYYGVYSSVVRARHRRVTSARPAGQQLATAPPLPTATPTDPDLAALRRRWAELLRRIYEVDPLVCPRCHGPMRIIALITEPRVIHNILRHLTTQAAHERSPPHDDSAAVSCSPLDARHQ